MRRSADAPLRGNQAGFHPKAKFVKHGLITSQFGQSFSFRCRRLLTYFLKKSLMTVTTR